MSAWGAILEAVCISMVSILWMARDAGRTQRLTAPDQTMKEP